MNTSGNPSEFDPRRCPQCRGTLVFSNRYPVLSVGLALTRSRAEAGDGIRRAGMGLSERTLRPSRTRG